MSKVSKGTTYERLARIELEKLGYLVERKNRSRWSGNDFWGLFDLIAIKPDGSAIKLVQVKTYLSDFYKSRKQIKEWCLLNGISNISCEVWLKEPRKDWRIDCVNLGG